MLARMKFCGVPYLGHPAISPPRNTLTKASHRRVAQPHEQAVSTQALRCSHKHGVPHDRGNHLKMRRTQSGLLWCGQARESSVR